MTNEEILKELYIELNERIELAIEYIKGFNGNIPDESKKDIIRILRGKKNEE